MFAETLSPMGRTSNNIMPCFKGNVGLPRREDICALPEQITILNSQLGGNQGRHSRAASRARLFYVEK